MKPKVSTGYLTPQTTKTKNALKNTPKPLSASKPSTSKQNNKEVDDKVFQTLMNDPVKKAMILQLLTLNKDAIEDYRKKEAQGTASPVEKVKKKRQIESPTSLLRRRALEKLNSVEDQSRSSPTLSESNSSRVSTPNSEVSGTSETDPSVPFNKIMDGVVAFVEIRSKDQDRSGGAKKILQAMGAKVRDTFTRDVTHVIFKDGSFATYQKAKLMKVHLVSILWVEFSRKSLQRQPEKKFAAMRTNYFDDNTSVICSQMQKEYEDIIRDEYRHSLINGTPLPSTRSLIDRRRTLMTTSSSASDFQNTINSSSQEMSDREVAQINDPKNTEKEILTINFLYHEPSPEIGSPLKSIENTRLLNTAERNGTNYNSDMELTRVDSETKLRNSFYQRATPKLAIEGLSDQTPSAKKSSLAPTNLFDRRKTICSSIVMSDESSRTTSLLSTGTVITSKKTAEKDKRKTQDSDETYCSLMSSDRSTSEATKNVNKSKKKKVVNNKTVEDSDITHCSLISSDRSNENFAVPKTAKKSKKCTEKSSTTSIMSVLEISKDDDLQILSGNVCKQNNKSSHSSDISSLLVPSEKPHSPQRKKTSSSTMSSLHLSSEKQLLTSNNIDVTKKSTDSIMSSLNLSSENPKLNDEAKIKRVSAYCRKVMERTVSDVTNGGLDISKKSFASSDSSVRLDEQEVERVLGALQSPITVRKPRSVNSMKSNASVISNDSEIEFTMNKTPKKISKITKKSAIEPKKNIDNQTLLDWLTEGDNVKSTTKNNSKKNDDIEIINSSTTDIDYSPKKRKSKLKRLSKKGRKSIAKSNPGDSSDQEENSPRKVPTTTAQTLGERRKSMRLSRRMSRYEEDKFKKPVMDNKSKILETPDEKDEKTFREKKSQPKASNKKRTRSANNEPSCNTNNNSNKRKTKSDTSLIQLSDSERSSGPKTTNNRRTRSVNKESKSDSRKNSNTKKTKSRKQNSDSENKSPIKIAQISSDSDSNNKSKSSKRKLYVPNEFTPRFSQPDDEKDRENRIMEIKKRRSIIPNEQIKELAHSPDDVKKNTSDIATLLTDESPKKKVRKQRNQQTKVKTPDVSADEQISLLNEILGRRAKTVQKSRAKKKSTISKPGSAKTYKESTKRRGIKKTGVNLFSKSSDSSADEKPNIKNFLNRRSTLDFQSKSQIKSQIKVSPSKKLKAAKAKLPTIVCTKLHKSDVEVFARIVKKLGGFVVEDEVSSRTTHVVAGEPKRTINMLRAVARGCWILKHEWLLKSLENGKWLPEEDYEVTDFAPVVQKSRLERQAFGSSYTMNIFEECDPIYVALGTNPRCSDLRELIELCKGKVVTTPRIAKIVVGEYVNEEDVTCVNEIWILDCITFNKKLPFKRKYLLTGPKSRRSIEV